MQDHRIEEDSLGKIDVPKNAYYGAFTTRAKNNFKISDLTIDQIFKESLGIVKLAAAKSNQKAGLLSKEQAGAIEKACLDFISGNFDSDFTLDIFQAGAGTGYNMNANEIIANRANELLGEKKGTYTKVHPNNHVNMGQSTNDVIPTASRIALLLSLPSLLNAISELEETFEIKSKKYAKVIKVARTHLQDAVPITFKQTLDSYKEALKKSRNFLTLTSQELHTLGIGGTAAGTGINSHPEYQKLMIKFLSELTGLHFDKADNCTEIANNMNAFLNFSSGLRSLTTSLLNICSDLKLMNMGPKAGLAEITIPEVQAGSSIMPGKVNPSIIESVEMACIQALGNDKVVEIAAQKSQFELNIMCPVIIHNLLFSVKILKNSIRNLNEKCVKHLEVNTEKVKETYENSLCTGTALAPYLGYNLTAQIIKDSLKNKTTIREEILKRELYSEKELDQILSTERITTPSNVEKKWIKKTQ